MVILGIETSCDETSVAVVKNGTQILSNIVASSSEMHAKTGGIIPEQAARQQLTSILPAVGLALENSKQSKQKIDAIAVTAGPGLIGSLLVGVETAKTLSFLWKKPIVPINHLVAHIYASLLSQDKSAKKKPQFPAIALVVSGGHTDLVLLKNHGDITRLGATRDDAAGEAFDKTARLLGLSYPGGPAIAREADKFLERHPKLPANKLKLFPRPMINSNDFDFSFSGLKTSVLNELKKFTTSRKSKMGFKDVQKYSAEIQEAIVETLVLKTIKAVEVHKPKSLVISGGVAANNRLAKAFKSQLASNKLGVDLHVPAAILCTDNAAPIAATAFYNYFPIKWSEIRANPNLQITQ